AAALPEIPQVQSAQAVGDPAPAQIVRAAAADERDDRGHRGKGRLRRCVFLQQGVREGVRFATVEIPREGESGGAEPWDRLMGFGDMSWWRRAMFLFAGCGRLPA